MNNDSTREILEELGVKKYRADSLVDNMQAKIDAAKLMSFKDADNSLQGTLDGLDDMIKKLDKVKEQVERNKKDYQDIEKTIHSIRVGMKTINEDSKAKDNAKNLAKIVKDLEKLDNKDISGEITEALAEFVKAHDKAISTAVEYSETIKREAKTLEQSVSDGLRSAKNTILQLSNAFNLQRLVGGGIGLKDLNKMQGDVKISMNLDNSEFLGLQRKLVQVNESIQQQTGEAYLTFSDTVSYLSNIQDYSFKNYNQSIALYKQVMVGNKYLGLSNQSLSSMVKATNQLADDSYMNRQMAILAALGGDSGISENMESLAQFSAENIAGLAARYNNPNGVMASSMAGLSVADAYLGNNSSLVHSLMSEIMNASDFANLSQQTQLLLSIASANGGVSVNEITQMMRTGNMDGINRIIQGVLQGTYNFSQLRGGSTTLDMYGLGQWNTTANSFNNNRDEYLKSIDDQLKVLSKYDLSTKEGMEQALEELQKQNDNRTFWEKFQDGIFNLLGVQSADWNTLLGIVQLMQTGLALFTGVTSLAQLKEEFNIKQTTRLIALKMGISKGDLPSLGGGVKSVLGGMAIAGGLAWGLSDAATTSNRGDNWARGAFLGTGYAGSDSNGSAILRNAGKYALTGAGIGMMLGHPIIGAAIGGILGLALGAWGASLDSNTEAVEKNTDVYKKSNDSIATKSYMKKVMQDYYDNMEDGSGGALYDGSSGASSVVGNPTSNYKYRISSGFGFRYNPVTGKPEGHKGVDFVFPYRTPVGAAQSGKVTASQSGFNGGAGQFINILGVDGMLYRYYHLNTRYVNVGDNVIAGQPIGLSGGAKKDGANAGTSTGPHLHFQVQNGKTPVQPLPYVTTELFNAGTLSTTLQSQASKSNIFSTEAADSNLTYRLSKESLFNINNSPTSQGGATNEPPVGNYATSSDVDRLIDVIREVNEVKENQRELMRVLAGQNSFIYGKE